MPNHSRSVPEKDELPAHNYDADPQWASKPLTPAQLLVMDVRLETWRAGRDPKLEINERFASVLVPGAAALTPSASIVRATEAATNPIEQQRFIQLEEEYGWIRYLRLRQYQWHIYDPEDSAKCRWIHVSSKFPEYLAGILYALTDNTTTVAGSIRLLDHAIQRQTRFSKHGKYFAPFYQPLSRQAGDSAEELYPMLMSVPFLDWSLNGPTPPLRFQVDRREGFHSSKSSAHLLRSVLQHFYRLEETADRERSQVFNKHKPWTTNRELDLKVRQWYGHYPSALNVDELWILVIDPEHIVTFSSNQTWKSRWPPLQLTSRISDISFRGIRNHFYRSQHESQQEYTALTHGIACLSAAVGMMHRNFWSDMILCMTDRYAGYLGHLQYRLHRSPNSKLVMDLIACQEELNIVIQLTQQQIDMISELQSTLDKVYSTDGHGEPPSPPFRRPVSSGYTNGEFSNPPLPRYRATYRQLSFSNLTDPIAQLLDNLQRELVDLQDLRDNANTLVTRTIQLVNIRLEDHGKAILVFTVVTIVFLPMNFVSSFFGMNVSDIRGMSETQSRFWVVAVCVTAGVLALSVFLAFRGGDIVEKLLIRLDARREQQQLSTTTVLRQSSGTSGSGFRVYGSSRLDGFSMG